MSALVIKNNYNQSSKQPVLVNTSTMLKFKYIIEIAVSGHNNDRLLGFNDIKKAEQAFLRLHDRFYENDTDHVLELKYAGWFNNFRIPKHPEYTQTKLIGPTDPKVLKRCVKIGRYYATTE